MLVPRLDLHLRRDGLFWLDLWHMGALVGDIMSQRRAQLFAVVGEELCVIGSARNCDVSHAVVEQVFRARLCIDGDQYAVGGLALTGMTGPRIAMIEMPLHFAGSSCTSRPPSILRLSAVHPDTFDRPPTTL